MSRVFLLLGSNKGDRCELLSQACNIIEERCGTITSRSSLYESEPWGFKADIWFLNQAVELSTDKDPYMLMLILLNIERELGRRRNGIKRGYASRTIDIDILYYDKLITTTPELILPHPRLQDRRFVLVPMCQIAPDLVHPLLKATQRELLEKCTDKSNVRLYKQPQT